MDDLLEFFRSNPGTASSQAPGSSRLYGVELEFEGVPTSIKKLMVNNPFWLPHTEHSLRGTGACEYVSAHPLPLKQVQQTAAMLYETFSSSFHTNHRTGMHVHVNVLYDLGWITKNLLAIWFLLEPVFMKTTSKDRARHIFCWQLGEALGDAPLYADLLNMDHWSHKWLKSIKFNRYTTLNLASLVKHGTVEFRYIQTPSTYDKVREHLQRIDSLLSIAQNPDMSGMLPAKNMWPMTLKSSDCWTALNLSEYCNFKEYRDLIDERTPLYYMHLEHKKLVNLPLLG